MSGSNSSTPISSRAIQYQFWEVALSNLSASLDLHHEGALRVEITDPFGDIRWREGFWDGGVWRLRWMPLEAGPHHLRIETDLAELPESMGVVVDPVSPSAFGFHHECSSSGPVRIADDRVRFARADGQPFFLKSDSAFWGAIRSTDAEWAHYVRRCREQGFTAVEIAPFDPTGSVAHRFGQTISSLDDALSDLTTLADVDRKIVAANAAGLVPIVYLPPIGRWPLGLGVDRGETIRLGRHLVARWGGYDVLWLLSGDGDQEEEADDLLEVGQGIFGSDPWRAPVGVSVAAGAELVPRLQNENWIGWLNHHGQLPTSAESPHQARPKGQNLARRPIVNRDPVPGDTIGTDSPDDNGARVRESLRALFAHPPAGSGYSIEPIVRWRTRGRPIPTIDGWETLTTGESLPLWAEALEDARSKWVGAIDALLSRRFWQDLWPARELPEAGSAEVLVLADAARERIRAYLPSGGEVRFPSLSGVYDAAWVDPATGQAAGIVDSVDGSERFVVPGVGGWLLWLDVVDAF